MKNILFLFTIIYSFNTSAQTFEKIKLAENEVPAEYKITEKQKCISIQACSFYNQIDLYSSFIGKVKLKEIQSFESKDDNGSIMYFEFEDYFLGESFLIGLLYGKSMKATKEHPDEYFIKGKFLIMWSFEQNSELKRISKEKIKLLLK